MNTCKIKEISYITFEVQNSFQTELEFSQNDLSNQQASLVVNELRFRPPHLICSSSVPDKQEEQKQNIDHERKQKRMNSNRESARRSRMRKKRQQYELWSQLLQLTKENNDLMDKLNHTSRSHDQVLEENSKLKKETADLRQMLMRMQFDADDFMNPLTYLEIVQCNACSSS